MDTLNIRINNLYYGIRCLSVKSNLFMFVFQLNIKYIFRPWRNDKPCVIDLYRWPITIRDNNAIKFTFLNVPRSTCEKMCILPGSDFSFYGSHICYDNNLFGELISNCECTVLFNGNFINSVNLPNRLHSTTTL